MSILEAIKLTLKIKEYCTLTDITKATGLKYGKVLEEIANNKHLLDIDKKGQIVRIVDVVNIQCRQAFKDGLTYVPRPDAIPPRIDTCADVPDDMIDSYMTSYVDSSKYIPDTEENKKRLDDMGIMHNVYYRRTKTQPIESFWNQPNKCMNLLKMKVWE